ncbi:hypothetical protein M758_4G039200 [Ceratodon purpureus]|nr:hypothetical protein M758_4G039200 [Ceratodon purpureus]
MSRQTLLLCVFAVLLQWQPWSVVSAGMAPPKGYSMGFTATIGRGTQKYVCNRGSWIKTGSSADLIGSNGKKLGSYGSIYDAQTGKSTYYWTIINSAGGYYESGQAKSGLQAKAVKTAKVFSSAVIEYLAIVKVHRGAGDASQVAFVSLSGTKGGMPPRSALCTSHGSTSGIPFKGTFTFYNQDRQPPQVPASLTPKGTFLQMAFLDGKITYMFAQGRWRYVGIFATIYDVAGGVVLGKFGTVSKADRFGSKVFIKYNNPNGFWLYGQLCAKPVRMDADGFAWQLMKITTSGGVVSPMGKYTQVLMGSTIGGLAPRIAAKTDGMTWSPPFTAQMYMYTA